MLKCSDVGMCARVDVIITDHATVIITDNDSDIPIGGISI